MFRKTAQFLWMALVLSTVLVLPGCPGAKPAPISGYTPLGSVSVMVIVPQSTTIGTGTTQQFTATVNNSAVSGVQWEVNGFPGGGGDVGTIDTSGNYTAPQFVPKNPQVTITAVADADNTQSGSANVTITGAPLPATVGISPTTAALQVGKSLTFSATVTGPADTSVSWQVNGVDNGNTTVGTIEPGDKDTAVYTAPAQVPSPATVTVTAISNSDPTKSASAQVTISTAPPNLANVSISPTSATVQAGHSFDFTAGVTGISDTSIIWEVGLQPGPSQPGGNANLGTVTTGGMYTAPPQLPSVNTVYVTAASQAQPSRTASATVTLTPPSINSVTISLSPSSTSVDAGGNTQFKVSVGNTTNTSVTWEVSGVTNGNSTVGTITPVTGSSTTVNYDAPAVVPAANPVIITAIPNADPSISATASVTILQPPTIIVTVSPASANVQVSTTQQFTAAVENAEDETVTWQLVPNSGCNAVVGSIVTSGPMGGLYSAPAAVPTSNCNPVTIEAVSNQDHKTFGTATATIVNILPVQITLSPTNPSVEVNDSETFTATVTNTTDTAISDWQVNGIGQANGGGNATVGTIVPVTFDTAAYTAPASVPNPNQVTITAVSEADPTKTASTTVTIAPAPPPISVTINPSTPVNVLPGQSQTFSANVNGTTDQVVYWTLSVPGVSCTPSVCGTINPSTTNGLPTTYTAPQSISSSTLTVTVTATADAQSSATATDSVIISENTTLSISVSPANPAPIAAGSTSPVTFNAIVGNAPADTNVIWSMGCISLYNGNTIDGISEGCGILYPFIPGPGCTTVNGGAPVCDDAGNPGPGDDPLVYTAPATLYTSAFEVNSCELTNDGSGNGQVPLTASVSYNGNVATATVCITVTPP